MATKHNPDPNNPTSKEGKRMALELKHEHMLAEAKKAAEERKRARSVGDTLQSPKRGCVGRGKPRGRRGGRRQGSATASKRCLILAFSAAESLRALERSKTTPPTMPSRERGCWCSECLPEEWFCGDCDGLHHKKQPLHNRDSLINGFLKPISPTTCVVRVEGGYDTHDQACILPTVKAPNCSCKGKHFTMVPGKPVILITSNGRYDLHLPLYWILATLYTLDLLSSFEELKVISPGFSRQAFAKLLEHRTKCGGRTQGRGPCGDSQWTAARETSRRASKLDEEGMEVAIIWSGKNQEGAGMTAGEEVEQVSSYLSCCALTTKYMSKAARLDMLTARSTRYVKTSKRLLEETASLEELKTELHCVSGTSGTSEDILQTALQQSIEGLYLSVRQRKQSLYRQNDSSKLCHRLRRKLADDKKRLNQEILKYKQLVHDSARGIDVAALEHSPSGGSIMSALWPWEVHGMANFTAKKKILDQNMAVALKNKVAEEDVDKGDGGLGCTLRRKHAEASERLQVVLQQFKTAFGPDASFLQHEEESQSGLSSPDTSEDEEGNII
ncbi:hypothetical protein KUCAC02_006563 [Chaenocephalus aceratus]|uniref:Uncharacterized protein n=1 Tax=Chaenocephalus aceratus TaxID=36190 RepID=A0ACB9VS27_CHAAC|nr:hypothetical protein KUCAC02_006563 [Chaenocephalus aceratus]